MKEALFELLRERSLTSSELDAAIVLVTSGAFQHRWGTPRAVLPQDIRARLLRHGRGRKDSDTKAFVERTLGDAQCFVDDCGR